MPSASFDRGADPLREDLQVLNERLCELTGEFEALRHERDHLSSELEKRLKQSSSVHSLQQELDETLADHARLQGRLTASRELEDAVRRLTEERDAAREEARVFRNEVEALCARVEQSTQARTGEMQRIRNQWSSLLSRPLVGLAAEREVAGQTRAEQLLAEARSEEGRLRVELDTAQGRIAALELELRKSNRLLALRAAEMDGLRHSAVDQVAAANVHAGELDQRVAQLEAALEVTRVTGKAIETDAERIGVELARAAAALRLLAERQDAAAFAESTPVSEDNLQPILFDLGDYTGPETAFDAARLVSKPAHDPRLLDIIEEAFNPTPPEERDV